MQYTKQRRTLASALAGFTALSLLLSACGSDDDSPDTATTASQEGEDSSEPEENMSTPLDADEDGDEDGADENGFEEDEEDEGASEGEDSDTDEVLPSKVVEAGTVNSSGTKTASGKNDALVTFKQSEAFAVVVEFECEKCKGDIEIQQLGAHSPLDTGSKSLSGSYLLDIIGSPDEEQTLIVRADGKWNVKLRSWNDLPISSGTQEGKGSEVIYIGDAASGVEVTYKPPKDGGELDVTITSAVDKDGDDPKVKTISGSKKFTKEEKIKLPGVLTISGKGSWTVKLVS